MNKIERCRFFKAIRLLLVAAFICLDISYACPSEYNPRNATLAAPSLLQQQPVDESASRSRQSLFSQSAFLASVYDAGEYFFGRPEKDMEPLPSKHAEAVVKAGLERLLSESGIEILNIVPVEYLKKTVPEKLKNALDEIGFNGKLPDEGVVFILYRMNGKKLLVQVAKKGSVSPQNLPGYEWAVSDKYLVKYLPEDYGVPQGEILSRPKDEAPAPQPAKPIDVRDATLLTEEELLEDYLKEQSALKFKLSPEDTAYLEGKVIMIVGAGGTIGAELARQLTGKNIKQLVLVDNSENGIFAIRKELKEKYGMPDAQVACVIGDVRIQKKFESIFANYKPNVVFHFANYKSLSLGNASPGEYASNNIGGTRNLLGMACECPSVERFVFISSDEAENPSQNYGRTKRINELLLMAFAGKYPEIKFGSMRYSNVLDTAGSFAIPVFKDQILNDRKVTIRKMEDGDIPDRYFIPRHIAAKFAIKAGDACDRGEAFSLDKNKIRPIRIDELVKMLARRLGVKDVDAWFKEKVEFISVERGEKKTKQPPKGEHLPGTPLIKIPATDMSDGTLLDDSIDRLLSLSEDVSKDAQVEALMKEIVDTSAALTGDQDSGEALIAEKPATPDEKMHIYPGSILADEPFAQTSPDLSLYQPADREYIKKIVEAVYRRSPISDVELINQAGGNLRTLVTLAERLERIAERSGNVIIKARACLLLGSIYSGHIFPVKADYIKDKYIKFALKTIREASRRSLGEPKTGLKIPDEYRDKELVINCPIRVDLSHGGASDLFAMTYETGGRAINIAMDLDGSSPIKVRVKRLKEPVIRLISDDLKIDKTITSKEEILAYEDKDDSLRLFKAALAVTDIVRQNDSRSLRQLLEDMGGGIELRSESSVPKGSGLGVSSILGTGVLEGLYRISGQEKTKAELVDAVLYLEQVLGVGGGWQDPVGGAFGGIKVITSKAGKSKPVAEEIKVSDEFVKKLEGRMVLYYTGASHFAGDILTKLTVDYISRSSIEYKSRQRLVAMDDEIMKAISNEDIDELGAIASRYWEEFKILNPEASPEEITKLFDNPEVKELIAGGKLCGAGGGGFAFFIAKEGKREELEKALNLLSRNPDARTYRGTINREGFREISLPLDESAELQKDAAGKIGFNPIQALNDPEISNVFRQIIERRYDVRALSEIYRLGGVPGYLTHKGKRLTVSEYAYEIIDFLRARAGQDPHAVARAFRKEFPNMARPPELDEIFDKYMGIKLKEFDLEVVRDAIPQESIIADIGAGKNKLGRAILEYSDQNGLGVKNVVGTDLNDWTDKTGKPDHRLSFVYQESGVRFPLSSDTFDTVIVKWVLHHMSQEDQIKFLKSIKRILKPGGRIIIFEAMGTAAGDEDIQREFRDETKNPRTWPAGSFREANLKLTEDFMRLTADQQRKVNALEDYLGHNLVMGRDWMPQPFTYLPVTEFQSLLAGLGFTENKELRRIYGSMPIMRMGPPSVRLVFEKKATSPVLVRGDSREDKSMLLIDGITEREKEALKSVLDVLTYTDMSRTDLEKERVDDVVILGNQRLDTFSEALDLVGSGIGQRIVILGGFGAATIPLIDEAVNLGYEIKISDTTTVSKKNWADIKNGITDANQRQIIQTVEAEIIRQVIMQIIEKFPKEFARVRKLIWDKGLRGVIVAEGSSDVTRELLINYRRLLDDEKAFDKGHTIAFLHMPHQQLRAKAAFDALLATELRQGKARTISHAVSYANVRKDRVSAIKDLLTEAWKIAIYSDYGRGYINLRNERYPRGIGDIPQKFWEEIDFLFNSLQGPDKRDIAAELMLLAEKAGLPIDRVVKSVPGKNHFLRRFIEEISENAIFKELLDHAGELKKAGKIYSKAINDESILECVAGVFGVDEADSTRRFDRARSILRAVASSPMKGEVVSKIKAIMPEYTWTASGSQRFAPLALAVANLLEGRDIFDGQLAEELGRSEDDMKYLTEKGLLYANPFGVDKKYIPEYMPKLKLPALPRKGAYRWLDIGSAPKESGVPTLGLIQRVLSKRLKDAKLEAYGTDIFFPAYVMREDGTIARNERYKFDANGRAEIDGIHYLDARLPQNDITSGQFAPGQKFDFASMCFVLHHLAGRDEAYASMPLAKKPLFDERKTPLETKYWLTETQQRAITNVLASLDNGGIFFLNINQIRFQDLLEMKKNDARKVHQKNRDWDLFVVIRKDSDDHFTVYDNAIPFRPMPEAYASADFLFSTKPRSQSKHSLIWQNNGIRGRYPEAGDGFFGSVRKLLQRADILAYRFQRRGESVWFHLMSAVKALDEDGAALSRIFEIYLQHVPAQYKEGLLAEVRQLEKEHVLHDAERIFKFLAVSDEPPKKADIIIAFGNEYLETVDKAVELFRGGVSDTVMFVGGKGHSTANLADKAAPILADVSRQELDTSSESAIMGMLFRKKLKVLGEAKEPRVILEGDSRDCGQNIQNAWTIIKSYDDLKKLTEKNNRGLNVIFIQQPPLQKRLFLTFKRWQGDKERPIFPNTVVNNQPAFGLPDSVPLSKTVLKDEEYLFTLADEAEKLEEYPHRPGGGYTVPLAENGGKLPDDVRNAVNSIKEYFYPSDRAIKANGTVVANLIAAKDRVRTNANAPIQAEKGGYRKHGSFAGFSKRGQRQGVMYLTSGAATVTVKPDTEAQYEIFVGKGDIVSVFADSDIVFTADSTFYVFRQTGNSKTQVDPQQSLYREGSSRATSEHFVFDDKGNRVAQIYRDKKDNLLAAVYRAGDLPAKMIMMTPDSAAIGVGIKRMEASEKTHRHEKEGASKQEMVLCMDGRVKARLADRDGKGTKTIKFGTNELLMYEPHSVHGIDEASADIAVIIQDPIRGKDKAEKQEVQTEEPAEEVSRESSPEPMKTGDAPQNNTGTDKLHKEYGPYAHSKWVYHSDRVEELLKGNFSDVIPVTVEFVPSLNCNYMCSTCTYGKAKQGFEGPYNVGLSTDAADVDTANIDNVEAEIGKANEKFAASHQKPIVMDWETMKTSLDRLKEGGLKAIIFTGGGEPLTNPNTIRGMRYAKEVLGLKVALYTNGSLLTEEKARELIAIEPDFIRISLDAGTEKTFNLTHGLPDGSKIFERVLGNLEMLAKEKLARGSKTTIGIGVIVNPLTAKEVDKTVEAVKAVSIKAGGGIDYIAFRPTVNYVGGNQFSDATTRILRYLKDNDPESYEMYANFFLRGQQFPEAIFNLAQKNIEQAGERVKAGDVEKLVIPGTDIALLSIKTKLRDVTKPKSYSVCLAHSWFTEVWANGDVFLCSELNGNPEYRLGSLRDQTFKEIWDSDRRKEVLRKIDLNKKCPPVCKLHEYNQLFQSIKRAIDAGNADKERAEIEKERANPPPPHLYYLTFNFYAAVLGATALGSIFSEVKDLALAYQVIGGIAVLGILAAVFYFRVMKKKAGGVYRSVADRIDWQINHTVYGGILLEASKEIIVTPEGVIDVSIVERLAKLAEQGVPVLLAGEMAKELKNEIGKLLKDAPEKIASIESCSSLDDRKTLRRFAGDRAVAAILAESRPRQVPNRYGAFSLSDLNSPGEDPLSKTIAEDIRSSGLGAAAWVMDRIVTEAALSRLREKAVVKDGGAFVVLSGFSGAGKGTLFDLLSKVYGDKLVKVLLHTTRAKRNTEKHGREYYFESPKKFEKLSNAGGMISVKIHDNMYGVMKEDIESSLKGGRIVFVEVGYKMQEDIRKSFPRHESIFVLPTAGKTIEEVQKELAFRLHLRNTDDDERIAGRLKTAIKELPVAAKYDHSITNYRWNVLGALNDLVDAINSGSIPADEKTVKDIFKTRESILEADKKGTLSAIFPRWSILKDMKQWNTHRDTVGEHTMGIIKVLHDGKFLDGLDHPEDLLLTAFLHDFGKDKKFKTLPDNHEVEGSRIVHDNLISIGFRPEEAKRFAWYVRHHSAAWRIAFKGDLQEDVKDENLRTFLLKLRPQDVTMFALLSIAEMMQVLSLPYDKLPRQNVEWISEISNRLKTIAEQPDITRREKEIEIFIKYLSARLASLAVIESSIMEELAAREEVSTEEGLFILVQSRVPAAMKSLTSALKELEPMSKQEGLSADAISQAVARAKEKFRLSGEETKILWLALLGPGQGMVEEGVPEGTEDILRFEAKIKSAFRVNPRFGMSYTMLSIRYNNEGLPEPVVIASLKKLGFEERDGKWYRVAEKGEAPASAVRASGVSPAEVKQPPVEAGQAERKRTATSGIDVMAIYSFHLTKKDADFLIQSIGRTKDAAEQDEREMVIVLEHTGIDYYAAREWFRANRGMDPKEFAAKILSDETFRQILKEKFYPIAERQAATDLASAQRGILPPAYQQLDSDSFNRRLWAYLSSLKASRKVRIDIVYEAYSPELWIKKMMRSAVDIYADHLLASGEIDPALNFRRQHFKMLFENAIERDVFLSEQVELIRKENPNALVVVPRGISHRQALTYQLNKSNIAVRDYLDEGTAHLVKGLEGAFDMDPLKFLKKTDQGKEIVIGEENDADIERSFFEEDLRAMLIEKYPDMDSAFAYLSASIIMGRYDRLEVEGLMRFTAALKTAGDRRTCLMYWLEKSGRMMDEEQRGLKSFILEAKQWAAANSADVNSAESRIVFNDVKDNTSIVDSAKPETAQASKTTQLFEIVESALVDKRTEFIDAGNRLIDSLAAKTGSEVATDIGALDEKMTTAKIGQRVERAIAAIEKLDKEGVAPETRTAIELLKKNLSQFEADGGVASLIFLARRAKRENQKLIIGLETGWIPGIKNGLQQKAIFALMREMDSIAEALRSMGLDNVEVVHEGGSELAGVLLNKASQTQTSKHNIVVMASAGTINSDSFAALRNADEGDRPFLAGIDPAELIKLYAEFGESVSSQLHIRLAGLFYMTMELAAGKEPPQTPMIASYDKKMRIVIFLPSAKPMDYEMLKNNYAAEKAALQAA